MRYQDFLQSKSSGFTPSGFNPDTLPEFLFDYQRFAVTVALQKGRFALFAGTGLGKTAMELVWAEKVFYHTNKPVLILAPLSVAKQTAYEESDKFGIKCQYCESQNDVIHGINITNYQKLDKFDTSIFSGVVLDESSILKSFTGAIRTQLIDAFIATPYKLACSATPSPNDHMELGNHAEFLGIMSRVEMLATYFVHDGGDTSKWRLKKHAKNPFWQFLASWSLMFQKPSDIGFDDSLHILPSLNVSHIAIETGNTRDGELFTMPAIGLTDQRQAKKQSMESRVNAVCELVNNSDDQWIVWCETNDESAALTKMIPDAIEVKGSDSDNHKESAAIEFAHGHIRVLVSKPSIFGFGMNWQNCHNVAFVGISNSFELTYQAIRRCYRFGQTDPVNVWFAVSDTDGAIVDNMKRKSQQFEEMLSELIPFMGLSDGQQLSKKKDSYMESNAEGQNYNLFNGDCVEGVANLPSNSIDFSIFSPPFSSLYTYSNSDRDMGNAKNDEQFMDHFQFLANELFRVMKPGCLLSFHVQNLPAQIQRDGYYGRKDLRGDLIRSFEQSGFIYYSEVTIWKDPVVQMQRTKALGLLHKQIRKDSSKCHQGHADYLVTMRKPGEREFVAGLFDEFYGLDEILNTDSVKRSIEIWQRYASPVWMDIDQSDTLQFRTARENDDERHICPLQLTVIRRALQLWTNPGDTVLSPFAGIGSEGYVALDMDRKFIGFELKKSYFDVAVKNLRSVENKPIQLSLVD